MGRERGEGTYFVFEALRQSTRHQASSLLFPFQTLMTVRFFQPKAFPIPTTVCRAFV